MAEEAMNSGQSTTAETATAGTEGQTNNTANASEGVNTQQTGRTAQDRIQQLVKERDEWKAKAQGSTTADKPAPALQGTDEEWKRKIELEMSVPTFLKEKVEDMTAYWQNNPKMSKSDVYKVFTPVDILVKQAQDADNQANSFQTGGPSNPAARQETPDMSKMDDKALRAELEKRIAAGEKV